MEHGPCCCEGLASVPAVSPLLGTSTSGSNIQVAVVASYLPGGCLHHIGPGQPESRGYPALNGALGQCLPRLRRHLGLRGNCKLCVGHQSSVSKPSFFLQNSARYGHLGTNCCATVERYLPAHGQLRWTQVTPR